MMVKLNIIFYFSKGVQVDAKISPNGEDVNWNTVWKSSVNITKNGWSTEIEFLSPL